jgi:hypothetical protein
MWSRDVVKATLVEHNNNVESAAQHLCLPAEVVREVADEAATEKRAKEFTKRIAQGIQP